MSTFKSQKIPQVDFSISPFKRFMNHLKARERESLSEDMSERFNRGILQLFLLQLYSQTCFQFIFKGRIYLKGNHFTPSLMNLRLQLLSLYSVLLEHGRF